MEKKKEKADLEKTDYEKRLEVMRKQYEERRRIERAIQFQREYEWWQKLRAEHPGNTLDFV